MRPISAARALPRSPASWVSARILSGVLGLALALPTGLSGQVARAAETLDSVDTSVDTSDDTSDEAPATAPTPGDAEVTVENQEPETQAGIGGSVISSTNPEARRARAELEGTSLFEETTDDVPERLPPLQRAAWWTVFGSFSLATAGGVFAGLAEVQESRALRFGQTLSLEDGGAYLYEDRAAEYEAILARGQRQAWIARGLLIGAGVALIAGVSLFAVDGKRRRRGTQARLRPRAGGLEVRF